MRYTTVLHNKHPGKPAALIHAHVFLLVSRVRSADLAGWLSCVWSAGGWLGLGGPRSWRAPGGLCVWQLGQGSDGAAVSHHPGADSHGGGRVLTEWEETLRAAGVETQNWPHLLPSAAQTKPRPAYIPGSGGRRCLPRGGAAKSRHKAMATRKSQTLRIFLQHLPQ